jgi:hypothetical protein
MISIIAHSLTGIAAVWIFLGVVDVPLWIACVPSFLYMGVSIVWKVIVESFYMILALLVAWLLVSVFIIGGEPTQVPPQTQKAFVHQPL